MSSRTSKVSRYRHFLGRKTLGSLFLNGLQTMELNFDLSRPIDFPEDWEKNIGSILPFLNSLNPHISDPTARNPKTGDRLSSSKSKTHHLNFEGSGFDRDHFHCVGRLHALHPQYRIPGWQHITLFKYALDMHGFVDAGSCWAYEGIVLPGRQMILGRWWSPFHTEDDDAICGPFIFWNVRKAGEDGALLTLEDSGSE